MHLTHARKARALIFAVALALGSVTPALAVETTSTTTESLDVLASITLTGVPASLSYGGRLAGETVLTAQQDVIVGTTSPTGARLEVKGTNLTGPGTIPATARSFVNVGSNDTGTIGGGALPAADTYLSLFNRGASFAGPITVSFKVSLAIPPSAAVGSYSGSLTFRAVTN